MNQVVKAKWIAALRSGEYKQGKGRLKRYDDSFCCLGVLCDLHRKEFGGDWIMSDYLKASSYLPIEVQRWSGVSINGRISDGMNTLSAMNDDDKSFEEIADIIEQYL